MITIFVVGASAYPLGFTLGGGGGGEGRNEGEEGGREGGGTTSPKAKLACCYGLEICSF